MNCQELEIVVTDLARNAVLEAGERDRALAHINECRECSERLADEQLLSAGLLAFSTASRAEQAPPAVEEKLLAAFRRRPEPVRHVRRWMAVAAAGSIAAAMLLFRRTPPTPPAAPAPKIVNVARSVPAPTIEAPRNTQVSRRPRRRWAPAAPEITAEFLPVTEDDGWTPLEGGRLVRVKLPPSALGVFGVVVDEERRPERIEADVMLSNDGLLRAIRFVK